MKFSKIIFFILFFICSAGISAKEACFSQYALAPVSERVNIQNLYENTHLNEALQAYPDYENTILLGLGRWGEIMYGELAKQTGVSNICGVARSNISDWQKKGAEDKLHLFHDENLNELLDNTQIGSAVITTQYNYHYEQVKKALLSGKDVLVEKPFTSTMEQAGELIDIARQRKLILAIGYEYIYDQQFSILKKVIESQKAGYILEVEMNMQNPEIKVAYDNSMNVIEDLGGHLMSMLHVIFGR